MLPELPPTAEGTRLGHWRFPRPDVGVDYVHDFGGWNLTVGGGGEWAFTQYTAAGASTSNKPTWYQLGFQVGFGHFAVGASGAYYKNYAHAGYAATTAASSDDGWAATVGGSYTIDAWSFGLQGIYASYEQNAFVASGVPGTSAQNETMWGLSLNGAYALGPGISLEGQVAYTQADCGMLTGGGVSVPTPLVVGVNANQVHSIEFDIGTAINF